ncbi:MAG: helix-turn-helix transcriptional regulator [Bacteroidales bacterium]|nr:helix-turn-helix transcriptional regulator [Bacteroidales bacterium]
MNKRLQQFLSAENISQAQFAESIGVARASISHILAGRNKPGFDFLESMARHYPNLNLEWLITGRGRMYTLAKSASEGPVEPFSPPPSTTSGSLFDEAPEPLSGSPAAPVSADVTSRIMLDKTKEYSNNQRNISKIIVFYTDGSYQEIV